MHRMKRFLGIALSLAALPSLSAASSVQKISNRRVIVTEETLAPGEAALLPSARPSVIVYFAGDQVDVVPASGKGANEAIRRGETVFEPAGTKSLKNIGSSQVKYVRTEFLTSGKQETWGKTGLPSNYKILVENRYVRAYDIRIAPHSYEPRHTHRDRVVISLSGAMLEHVLPNGQKQPVNLRAGEIVWSREQTHVGHNIGSTELWVICVEPK